jgi:hypothetical protein
VNDTFLIDVVEWLASDASDPLESVTNAEIAISIGQNRVTEVEDFQSKTVRKTIRASAGLVAMWILNNWWRILCEPDSDTALDKDLNWRMSHVMPAIGGGYVWPDLIFKGSDGSHIYAECKRSSYRDVDTYSPIRYLNEFSTSIPVETFEKSVSSFVERVLDRLAACGLRKTDLHDMWNDVQYERINAKASQYRRLEALLGIDPDEQETLISTLLRKWSKSIGIQALEEISAATDSVQIENVLSSAKEVSQSVKTFGKLPDLGYLDKGSTAPWQQGQKAAYELRKLWELSSGPIKDVVLADRLEMNSAKLNEVKTAAPFSLAVRGKADDRVGFVLKRPRHESRRFDIARLIGDHIFHEGGAPLRPATNALTIRQKFQRAFAAEFLCPSEMIKERFSVIPGRSLRGGLVTDLSTEYEVSEQLIFHHMENRDVLSHSVAQDALLFA